MKQCQQCNERTAEIQERARTFSLRAGEIFAVTNPTCMPDPAGHYNWYSPEGIVPLCAARRLELPIWVKL